MAEALVDSGIDPKIIKLFLFAPHQPNQLNGIEGVEIFQVGRDNDLVSSIGFLPLFSNSRHRGIGFSDWVTVPNIG